MNLEPNRLDKIRDKLLSIEMVAYRVRHLDRDDEIERLRGIRKIHNIYVELLKVFEGDSTEETE
jgi:hypothetical protein